MDAVLDAVEAVADQLLGDGTRPLPHFVHESMNACLDGRPPLRVRAREAMSWR
jgi:hypothetical protein